MEENTNLYEKKNCFVMVKFIVIYDEKNCKIIELNWS